MPTETTPRHHYGWRPQRPDQRDHLFFATAAPVVTPLSLAVNLSPGCPPILDQGDLGSCTANAISAAYDFERRRQGEPFMTPSRLFIYYNERATEGTVLSDAGAVIRDGFKVINTHGVCYESQWPYDTAQFTDRPWPKCYQTAKKNVCVNYLSLLIQGPSLIPILQANCENDVEASTPPLPAGGEEAVQLRQCLTEGFPFVYGFTVYESFESAQVAATGIVPLPARSEQVLGGHCVYCVGYDDTTGLFRCRNSWGTSWGQAGEFQIPYAYLTNPNLASDFWTIRLVN